MNLILTAGIYSLVGFEVTPSTIIGFLTILGFALYDVVVVFDKVQENTRGITANNNQTYGEAANLALNQSLMRSLNTSVVALLPVGGLLFIGAGLLGAGTLKDLGLVLFVGMAVRVPDLDPAGHPAAGAAEEPGPADQARTTSGCWPDGARSPGARSPRAARRGPLLTSPVTSRSTRRPRPWPAAAPKVGARPAGKRATSARAGRPVGAAATGRAARSAADRATRQRRIRRRPSCCASSVPDAVGVPKENRTTVTRDPQHRGTGGQRPGDRPAGRQPGAGRAGLPEARRSCSRI